MSNSSESAERVMNDIAAFVATHAWQDRRLALGERAFPVIFFDAHATGEDSTFPDREPQDWLDELDEYFYGRWASRVEEGVWAVIGVVGLGVASSIDSFAEMNNRGFIAVVTAGPDHEPGTVLWVDGPRFRQSEPAVIAASVTALAPEPA